MFNNNIILYFMIWRITNNNINSQNYYQINKIILKKQIKIKILFLISKFFHINPKLKNP